VCSSDLYYGAGAPEFLRTHPITTSRIADTRGRAETYPYRQVPNSQDYLLTKAKLHVSSKQSSLKDLITYFQAQIEQGTAEQRAAMQYGLGLSYLKQQKSNQAESIFLNLNKLYPKQVHYLTALAQVSVEKQDFANAKDLYLKLQQQFPNNPDFKFEYIAILLKSDQVQQALQLLKLIPYENQQHPRYYLLLAQSYGKLNQAVNLHRYMAEYYYSIGQTDSAIVQIKLAQKAKDLNFYLSSILEDRLNFFIAETLALKELQK